MYLELDKNYNPVRKVDEKPDGFSVDMSVNIINDIDDMKKLVGQFGFEITDNISRLKLKDCIYAYELYALDHVYLIKEFKTKFVCETPTNTYTIPKGQRINPYNFFKNYIIMYVLKDYCEKIGYEYSLSQYDGYGRSKYFTLKIYLKSTILKFKWDVKKSKFVYLHPVIDIEDDIYGEFQDELSYKDVSIQKKRKEIYESLNKLKEYNFIEISDFKLVPKDSLTTVNKIGLMMDIFSLYNDKEPTLIDPVLRIIQVGYDAYKVDIDKHSIEKIYDYYDLKTNDE